MSHPARLYRPGGVYYIVRRRGLERPYFRHAGEFHHFCAQLGAALAHCHADGLGLLCEPNAIHIAVRAGDISVGRLLQSLWAYCSDLFRVELPPDRKPPRVRPRIVLIADQRLLDLLSYLHWLPVVHAIKVPSKMEVTAQRPDDYPWISHPLLMADKCVPCINRDAVWQVIGPDAVTARRRYVERMKERPPPDLIRLFESCTGSRLSNLDQRAIEQLKSVELRECERAIRYVHHEVARFLLVDAQAMLSKRRTEELVFARKWVAWRVVQARIASLDVAAEYFGRTGLDFSIVLKRTIKRHPSFFDVRRFPVGGPILPLSVRVRSAAPVVGVEATRPGD